MGIFVLSPPSAHYKKSNHSQENENMGKVITSAKQSKQSLQKETNTSMQVGGSCSPSTWRGQGA